MKIRLPIILASLCCLIAVTLHFIFGSSEFRLAEAASSDLTIYSDQLDSSFSNWSWNSDINFSDTSNVNSGTNAISFTPHSWGALYLHTETPLTAGDYGSLEFSIKATDPRQKFGIGLYDENNQQMQVPTPLTDVGGDLTVGSYKHYSIPLSTLNPNNKLFKGVVIQDTSGQDEPTIYIDDLVLKAKQVVVTPTLAPTLSPSVAPTPIQSGPTPTGVPTTVSTSNETKTSTHLDIYTDDLQPNFENWSWDSSVDLKTSRYFHSGTSSLAFSITNPWGALYLHAKSPVDTTPYSSLQFAMRVSETSQQFSVIFHDENNNLLGNPISLSTFGNLYTTEWKTFTVPLSQLSAGNKHISGLIIQDTTGHAQPTAYIDDIRLIGTTTSSTTDATNLTTIQPSNIKADTSNPFMGTPLYVQPDNQAKKTADDYKRAGRTSDADTMMKIATNPTAMWAVGGNPSETVGTYITKTDAAGDMGVIVSYNIPGRDCGQYSQGGADANGYKSWISNLATTIGNKKAAVILEPDALGLDCLQNDTTYSLLRYAIETLSAQPHIAVYVEASTWVTPDTMSQRMQKIGIEKAQGFAINTSGYNTTDAMIQYGDALSSKLGGKHYVIDTSRNGAGPYDQSQPEAWCNPPGRALGAKPTANTGHEHVDAYLWIKVPGESDGTCRGGPSAGTWWPEYALGLAEKAAY